VKPTGLKAKLARLSRAGPSSSMTPAEASSSSESLAGDALADALRDAPRDVRIEKLRAAMTALASREKLREAREPSAEVRARSIPGVLRPTEHGDVHVVETYLEPAHHHGRAPVARALAADANAVAQLALDPAFAGVDLGRALYLDTETTGLAGGTGTVPFLVGMAWFEDESLRVSQLFLPELGREAPMLAMLADRLAAASCIVSYNGKAFDWPLLRTRFVMNRVKAPPLPPHLDLLHCARRAFKARMASLRLCEMERELLSMFREDDVDGADIPGIYLGYLRTGDDPRLARVIEHNLHDLVALAALLGELTHRYTSGRAADDPRDHLSFAKIAHRAGDPERARGLAARAAEGGGSSRCMVEATLLSARIMRIAKDLAEEERLLLAAHAAAGGDDLAEVALILAKLYEHRLRDPRRALRFAAEAAPAEEPAAHERRIARLRRRIGAETAESSAPGKSHTKMANSSPLTVCSRANGAESGQRPPPLEPE
jgi:uncharacterized protein